MQSYDLEDDNTTEHWGGSVSVGLDSSNVGYVSLSGTSITRNSSPATADNSTQIATTAFVNNFSKNLINGTLTRLLDAEGASDYSAVFQQNGIGFFMLCAGFGSVAATWTQYSIYTSSILPKCTCYGWCHNQDGSAGNCFLQIETNGTIKLRTMGGSVPTNNWYWGSIIFPVN